MALSTTLKKMIGKPTDSVVFEIEKNQIRRFANAIGETGAIHFDEKAARSAGYPSLIAPPTFASALQDFEALLERLEINPHAIMHAEEEYEYFKPIYAGDTVVVTHTVVDAYEKDAPRGRLVFVVVEIRGNDKRSKAIFKGRRVLVEVRK